MLLKEGISVWENKKKSQGFSELKVDWDWLGLIIKVSAKKFHEFGKLLLIKLGFYTIRFFILQSLFNAIMLVLWLFDVYLLRKINDMVKKLNELILCI